MTQEMECEGCGRQKAFRPPIVTLAYHEIVIFANMSNLDAFDVFECCEVFVLSIRAMYTLVMAFIFASNTCGNRNSNDLGTIWKQSD